MLCRRRLPETVECDLIGAWPRLTAPQRRRGRTRGKSDSIDALAVARAALQEPQLDGPIRRRNKICLGASPEADGSSPLSRFRPHVPGEETLRELKLLVDHRDDLVAERRRCQQRLRWHLHELDPNLAVPLGALDRAVWLDRLSRRLTGREQTTLVRIARDLLARCKTLTRSIAELDRDLQARTQTLAPRLLELAGGGPLSAAKLLCQIGPIERFRSDAQLARRAGVAPLDASSGEQRIHPPARAYLERKQQEGKTRREAIRCLKRQLARTVYTTLKNEPLLT